MNRDLQREMYEWGDWGLPQRISIATAGALGLIFSAYLLMSSGADSRRCELIFACFSIYYVRVLATLLVFLKRGMSWKEAATVSVFLLIVFGTLSLAARSSTRALGGIDGIGVALYVAGSILHTGAEFSRFRWKRRRENQGHLYTRGLFRIAIHVNYLGDLLLYTGMCLLASWWALWIPAAMLTGFVFVNIPALDSHLRVKYGAEFEEYESRTSKLVPYLY